MNPDGRIKKIVPTNTPSSEDGSNLSNFINHLNTVDDKNPEAKQNETSMKDAQGKRIIFNEENLRRKTFKGIEPRFRTFKGIEERVGTFKGVDVSNKIHKKF